MDQLLPHLRSDIRITPVSGKIIVITGENGIGKSTFLRHFYEFNGGAFSDQKPLDIFFDRSLSEFKKIILSSSGVIDHSFFETFWISSGLSEKEKRKLSHLSGGEAQLLKIISVCSAQGELYLLDEPGQYLDRGKKKFLREIISYLIEKKKSVIIVEHDSSWIPPGAEVNELMIDEGTLKVKSTWTT